MLEVQWPIDMMCNRVTTYFKGLKIYDLWHIGPNLYILQELISGQLQYWIHPVCHSNFNFSNGSLGHRPSCIFLHVPFLCICIQEGRWTINMMCNRAAPILFSLGYYLRLWRYTTLTNNTPFINIRYSIKYGHLFMCYVFHTPESVEMI